MQTSGPLASDLARQYLASRIDYERSLPANYDKRDFRLDRMQHLLARLGNPQQTLAIVHIAGTKGKGSTAAIIASVLSAAGYRTGLYSSPHLDHVGERLRIDGVPCPGDALDALVAEIQPIVAEMDALDLQGANLEVRPGDENGSEAAPSVTNRPTYFEVVTALALLRFAREKVDAAVLEVGLGGRLDSTNVCQPLVSVITSISFDHEQQLGNTLPKIAAEKAGIIKPGIPVVSGVTNDAPREVIVNTARANGCRLIELGRDFDFEYRAAEHAEQSETAATLDFLARAPGLMSLANLKLPLLGRHQAANAAIAVATLAELGKHGLPVTDAQIRQGLAQVRWPARIEVIARNPTVVLDAAHNVASAAALVHVLAESFQARHRVLVFATTRDKDARGMLALLLPTFDEVIFTRYWSNPRGVPPEELAALAAELTPELPVQVAADAAKAWALVRKAVTPDSLVCIAGSFFIAAEMRAAMAAESGHVARG